MNVLLALAVLTLAVVVEIGVEIALGLKNLGTLGDLAPQEGSNLPRVSIIVPALDEEGTIEPALASLQALDYPNREIIAVDDRSQDRTGEILDAAAARDPRLSVFHISDLPPGWLGKTHALQVGADRADGDFLLFMDADVTLEPSTLRRAMKRMKDETLDHLSLVFRASVPGGLLNAVVLEFGGALFWIYKPWKARDPNSARFMGVGAFNLVRKEAYAASGGHRAVALCPVDDIMLGKRIKQKGFRQDCMLAYGFVTVPWYGSLKEMADGLLKNIFAGFDYSVVRFLLAMALQTLIGVAPVLGFALGTGSLRCVYGSVILVRFLSFAHAAGQAGIPRRHALWSLLSPFILIVVSSRAVFRTLLRDGISWRGTFYPLRELKTGCTGRVGEPK